MLRLLEREILELADSVGRLSLADAFEILDAPVPDVFLTCRGLYATGDLERVGPGAYALSEFGRRTLDEMSHRPHHQSSRPGGDVVEPSAASSAGDAHARAASSASDTGGTTFDWSDHDDPQPSDETSTASEGPAPADPGDDADSDTTVADDGFIWSQAGSTVDESNSQ